MTYVLTLISTLALLTGIIYFGWRKPGYNHLNRTISELGEIGSPITRPVNYGLFLFVGVLLWVVAALTDENAVAGLAVCVGTGYVVAAFFPCDTGSPLSGSGRQQIHNLGGAVEYIGGAYFLGQFSTTFTLFGYDPFSVAAGSVLAGALLLSIPDLPFRGLVQRVIEAILFGSLLAVV
ncbi:DUF998 domain-containing protein [Spirosoma validum]|uniref:DUF998 domain-containing protein n=1 Tax=Spirosoma validum TaxID=2771355 RepID=A0A927B560_9BACT|nr:DUF998 domain-containing protein [Spirosoma validum]MBD2755625.1 DUF998 domain-containing protein [Spirosoma validum]